MKKFLISMGLCGLVEIAIVLGLTFWRDLFWSAVSTKNISGFVYYLGIFAGVTLTLCFVTSLGTYLGTRAAIKWREKLNEKAHQHKKSNVKNVAQRIEEDCAKYPDLCITIGGGVIKSIVYVLVFSTALALGFTPIWLLYVILFSISCTFVARWIGHPLINLNYNMQQASATYRNNLSKVNFLECINIQVELAKKLKHLQYFQSFYGQLGIIIPLIIIAPSYFSGLLTFGHLMQANSTMGTLLDNLSYGINSFDPVNKLLACRRRLKEIGVI